MVLEEKVTNEQVLERIGEKTTLLINVLCRKANWIGHILRRNCLLDNTIEGQITEAKGVERRRTQLLDDLRKLKIKIVGNDSLSIEHRKKYTFSISPAT